MRKKVSEQITHQNVAYRELLTEQLDEVDFIIGAVYAGTIKTIVDTPDKVLFRQRANRDGADKELVNIILASLTSS